VTLPRNLSGDELSKALARLGYRVARQTGSHMRLTTHHNGEHHVTVPKHFPLKVGTLNGILREVGRQFGLDREELLRQLFD
jgi:predicted RNA binding protein YcfA (HicA-like mRNA interferase family)